MTRPTIARVGIGVMAALGLATPVLHAVGLLSPLLTFGASGTAVVSIAGFCYYLTHRGPR